MPDGFMLSLNAIVKASTSGGKRFLEVEASNEAVDGEGDQILQSALMGSKSSFLKDGCIDIDHISEIGHRLGVPNPESWIIGVPVEVIDLGKGRTAVKCEIRKSADGAHNPRINKYDAFWDTMTSEPPVQWRASIYGYPNMDDLIDCTEAQCKSGATRYIIKSLDWRSLAMTRNPVNDAIKGYAKIVKANERVMEMIKSGLAKDYSMAPEVALSPGSQSPYLANMLPQPRNLADAVGQRETHMKSECPYTAGLKSTGGYAKHFELCCGMSPDMADVWGHALMHHGRLENRRS